MLTFAIVVAGLAAGGGRRWTTDSHALAVVGSDTMAALGAAWAADFHRQHPDVSVAVSGGGSGTGFSSLLAGRADIVMASRPARSEELGLASAGGRPLGARLVGHDALAIIVHLENRVPLLTLLDLRRLFAGEIRDWAALGGRPGPVVVVSREHGSGTQQFFHETILSPLDFRHDAFRLPASRLVVNTVARTPGAVGYVGLGFLTPEVRAVPLAEARTGIGPTVRRPAASSPAALHAVTGPLVAPSPAAVRSGRYALARPLWLYWSEPASPAVLAFLDLAVSPQGQLRVEQAGYVSLATGP